MIDIELLMANLALRRPIFHSEADFQHELAWEARLKLPDIQVRLEQPFPGRVSGAIDLIFYTGGTSHAVELKYLASRYRGEIRGELFHLKPHGAQDQRRYDVCRDIQRMEEFCSAEGKFGSVVVLTNDRYYWQGRVSPGTCAEAFDISGRSCLAGELRWADHTGLGTKKGRDMPIRLESKYTPEWKDYSNLNGDSGRFRYIHLPITCSNSKAATC